MEEIAARLATIEGLNTFSYRPDKIVPPAAFPDLPERIDYDGTYGRGMDEFPDLPVNVLVGKLSAQASHEKIADYVNGEGPRSFKATLDSSTTNRYTSCDEVHVKSVEFAIFTISGVDYLAASFSVGITGNGA